MGVSRSDRRPLPAVLLALAVVVALSVAACGQTNPTHGPFFDSSAPGSAAPSSPASSPAPSETDRSVANSGIAPGDVPAAVAGPDLGEAWTTEPDPETFIPLPDGTMVAPDQYLVMLDRSATQADAEKVAASVDGTIGGRIEYIGLWKVLVWPNYHTAIISDRLKTLSEQPGVLAAAPVTIETVQSAPDCAPGLADGVYAGTNSKPYDMIGVKAAWQAFYASGLPVSTVHVGFLDSDLTRDPKGKLAWEFDDVSFIGDPHTTQTPEATADGFHHADGTMGILTGDGQNGGIAGIGSPLGSRLLVSHDVLNGPATAGQPSKWTAKDGTTYTDDALLKTMEQIKSGATIINGSWGANSVVSNSGRAGTAAMWKKFFDQMANDHPNVLFVYAAGNYNSNLDGSNYYPGSIPAPNVITVGNTDNDGGRHAGKYGSNGVLPGAGGEVTLGAPGDKSVWGVGLDGKVMNSEGGTSSATPMVSATAALIRSIDPTLSAADIKKMIADSAATGDPEVGGKELRVDLAVRKAIDGARARLVPAKGPLTDKEIAAATQYCEINVTGDLKERLTQPAGASRWEIRGSVHAAKGPTSLSLLVGGAKPSNWRQAIGGSGQAVAWTILVPQKGVLIIVSRQDNGYWIKRSVRDTGPASPSPSPTASPSPTPAGSTYDCSNPPQKGTIAYAKWSLHCIPIGP
jgi:hypothetical protein